MTTSTTFTSQLRQIDEQAEILENLHKNDRITTQSYLKSLRRLTDRAQVILDRAGQGSAQGQGATRQGR